MSTGREASAEEALCTSIAGELGVSVEAVERVLAHREYADDWFWAAWDHTVTAGKNLYEWVVAADAADAKFLRKFGADADDD